MNTNRDFYSEEVDAGDYARFISKAEKMCASLEGWNICNLDLKQDGRFWKLMRMYSLHSCPNYYWTQDGFNPVVDAVISEANILYATALTRRSVDIVSMWQKIREYWFYDPMKEKFVSIRRRLDDQREQKYETTTDRKEYTVSNFFFYCIRRAITKVLAEEHSPQSAFQNAETPDDKHRKENIKRGLYRKLRGRLPRQHVDVLKLRLKGYDYYKIGNKIGITRKRVDNVLHQVKKILKKL